MTFVGIGDATYEIALIAFLVSALVISTLVGGKGREWRPRRRP